MISFSRSIFLFVVLLMLLTACGKEQGPSISPLDSPIAPSSAPSSVLPTPIVVSGADVGEDVIKFNIDEPLSIGASRVTGVGPDGFEISLVDVTVGYEILGSGKVDRDGKFDIEVAPSLMGGHRIGIVTKSSLSVVEFEKYAGDGRHFTAQGGWVLESAIVGAP